MGTSRHVQVGLENNIGVRRNRPRNSQVETVEDIKTLAEMFGRVPATPEEAREALPQGRERGEGIVKITRLDHIGVVLADLKP